MKINVRIDFYNQRTPFLEQGIKEAKAGGNTIADQLKSHTISRSSLITSSNISGMWHFVPCKRGFYQRSNSNGYLFLGFGGLYFNPKTTVDGKEYASQPLQIEGVAYSRFAFVIPFGVGAKMKLTPFVNLAFEAGWRKTFTDYLDDVGTVHLDPASITNPNVALDFCDSRNNSPVFNPSPTPPPRDH